MQSIILPVDFSRSSDAVLDYAAQLFGPQNVRFILLHAYSSLPAGELLISIDDIIENDINRKLEAKEDYLRKKSDSDKLDIIKVCVKNDIISAISSVNDKYHSDLLILGSDGENSWKDTTYYDEGKTLKIVSDVSIPSLIVPFSDEMHKPGNILFATVLEGIHDSNEVRPLIEIAKECKAHLDILNVSQSRSDTIESSSNLKKTINGYFKGVDFELHTIINKDATAAIGQFSEDHHNDLICIINRRHGILEKLLRPSVTKKIISGMARPILVLKQPA